MNTPTPTPPVITSYTSNTNLSIYSTNEKIFMYWSVITCVGLIVASTLIVLLPEYSDTSASEAVFQDRLFVQPTTVNVRWPQQTKRYFVINFRYLFSEINIKAAPNVLMDTTQIGVTPGFVIRYASSDRLFFVVTYIDDTNTGIIVQSNNLEKDVLYDCKCIIDYQNTEATMAIGGDLYSESGSGIIPSPRTFSPVMDIGTGYISFILEIQSMYLTDSLE